MLVVLSGASGLVGANLARGLLAQDIPVRAMVRHDRQALAGLDVDQVEADLLDPDSLSRAFSGADIVYHLAGLISLQPRKIGRCFNRSILPALVTSSRHACLRVFPGWSILAPSRRLQSTPNDKPVDEERPPAVSTNFPPTTVPRRWPEKEVQVGIRRGLDAVILNPTAIIGPYDFKPSYFGQASDLAGPGPFTRPGQGWFRLGRRTRCSRCRHPGGDESAFGRALYPLRPLAIAARAGRGSFSADRGTSPRVTVPMQLAWTAAPLMPWLARFTPLANGKPGSGQPIYTRNILRWLQSNPQVDHSQASRDLGYNPRSFQETITDTVNWFSDHGYFQRTHH